MEPLPRAPLPVPAGRAPAPVAPGTAPGAHRPSGRRDLGRRLVRLVVALVGTVLVALGLLASPVAAQDDETVVLLSSEPADGATLPSSPESISFSFSQPIDEDERLTAPVQCDSVPQAVSSEGDISDDEQTVSFTVESPLPRGVCTVSWRLSDLDTDETLAEGLIAFSVQSDPATPATDAETTETTAPATTVPPADDAAAGDEEGSSGGALWLGRTLSSIGVLALFGALVLIGAAWPEGPEYVITVRFLRSLWVLALVGTVLFVVAFTAEFTGEGVGASLSPTSWFDLADADWPGRAALARLVLVLASGWVVMRPERVIDPTTQLPAFVLPMLATASIGLDRVEGNWVAFGVLVGATHAIASAVWFGGALMTARVVLAGPGEDDLVAAVNGFSRISNPAILATVITGAIEVVRLVGGALFTSGHGRVVLLKTLVVAAMLFVAMTTRQMVTARLRDAPELSVPAADRFRRAFSAEAGLGVVVLALSGWLLALTPAQVTPGDAIDWQQPKRFVDGVSGLEVVVEIAPARVGLNGVRVTVDEPETGISNLVVSFTPPAGSEARGIEQPIPLTGRGVAQLDPDVGFPFDVGGTWTMELSAVTPDGTVTAATNTFQVSAADGSAVTTVVVDGASTTTTTTVAGDTGGSGDGSTPSSVTIVVGNDG